MNQNENIDYYVHYGLIDGKGIVVGTGSANERWRHN